MTLKARAILEKHANQLKDAASVTWTTDIAPLFAADGGVYIDHMKSVTNNKLDLSSYDSVVIWASKILEEVSSGNMPPYPYDAFTPAQVALFAAWIKQGTPK